MRLDSLNTLYGIGSFWKRLPHRGLHLPILMYHSISDDPEPGHPYFWINTSPAVFTKQLEFLRSNDYQIIPLAQALEMIRSFPDSSSTVVELSRPLSACGRSESAEFRSKKQVDQTKYAVLTFDDGFRDFFTTAFPLLKSRGFPATVFLPTDFIDHPQPGLRDKLHLSWGEVQVLMEMGITFGSHTCSHPQLHAFHDDQILSELLQSRKKIQEVVGFCDGFCYPYKFPTKDSNFQKRLKKRLQQIGYTYCLSTNIGTWHRREDLFSLKRIPINSGDDLTLFKAKLEGAYDWLSILQNMKKRFIMGNRVKKIVVA